MPIPRKGVIDMTATTFATSDTETTTTTKGHPLLKTGAIAGVIAAVATTAIAAVASATDVSDLAIAGEEIPVVGFAQMTLVWTLVGVGIAALLRRFTSAPRSAWIKVTVALVALSFVPDITADTDTATKLVLMLTHVVAAAIVIPALARRLPEHRA
jgi:hypothetical protein